MDAMTILGLVSKGVHVVQMLWEAGKSIEPAVKTVKNLIAGAQAGNITDEELIAIENELDKQIAEFNEPMDDA